MKEDSSLKRSWQIFYPIAAHFGIQLLVGTFVLMIYSMKLAAGAGPEALFDELMEFYGINAPYIDSAALAISAAVMFIFFRMDTKREYRTGEHVTYDRVAVWILPVLFILGAFCSATGNNIVSISGIINLYQEEMEGVEEIIYAGGLPVQLLATGLIAPVAEEILFRGLVYKRMRWYSPVVFSTIMSSLIFGICHGNLPQGIYAFMIGLVCAIVYETTHSLTACIVLHSGANIFSVLAYNTGVLDELINTDTAYWIYVFITALLTVMILDFVHKKGETKVLIPAAVQQQEEDGTQDR